jgi:SAM-dependent methyltransferase
MATIGRGSRLSSGGPGAARLGKADADSPAVITAGLSSHQPASDGRQIEVVSAPAERLPFPDGSFDAVVFALVLSSVGDQVIVLEEIRRVLRPSIRGSAGRS